MAAIMNTWYTETINLLFALILSAITGVTAYFWGRRRARERDLFLIWRNAFDRAAFRGPYNYHSEKKPFQRAMSMVIKSIASGKLFDSDGRELARVDGVYHGPSQIRNKQRQKAILDVRERLEKIRRLSFTPGVQNIDFERDILVERMNGVWKSLGIEPMRLPTEFKGYDDVAALLEDEKSTVAEQQKEIQALAASVKELAAQLQNVSAQIELNNPVAQTVARNQ
jgi:methyl-accepting chemotaxis protein